MLSLYAGDYRAAERTFQLLVQAAGRAGRGTTPGTAVIQTYSPDHYSIEAAAAQDYKAFFEQEMALPADDELSSGGTSDGAVPDVRRTRKR